MIYFLLILLVVIGLIWFSNNKQKKQNDAEGVLYYNELLRYLNGFPEISGGEHVQIKLTKDVLKVIFPSRKLTKEILVDNIIDAESSTEEQIQKDVSLGRLVVFGLLAFGMKKEKNVVKKYAVINYNDDTDKQRTLILEMIPDMFIKTILDIKSHK